MGGGPKTADGADFVVGMDLYPRINPDAGEVPPPESWAAGRWAESPPPIATDPARHEVVRAAFAGPDGTTTTEEVMVAFKGAGLGVVVRLYYSSAAARDAAFVRDLEGRRDRLQAWVDRLTAASSPRTRSPANPLDPAAPSGPGAGRAGPPAPP